MKKHIAYIELAGRRTKVEFETDILPIEFLWQRYGMSTYIESVEEVTEEEDS